MEKISKRLKEEWGYNALQPGEKRSYQLINTRVDPTTGLFICPTRQAILNKYVINDFNNALKGDKEMSAKTIFYITGQRPAPEKSDREFINIYGDIEFTKEAKGTITCYGDNPSNKSLDEFLFFNPANESNYGKIGHVRPKNGYLFRTIQEEKDAEKKLASRKAIRKAEELIEEMSDEDIVILCDRYLERETLHMSVVEKRDKLMDWVRKTGNLNKVNMFSEDYQLPIRRDIRAANKQGVIKLSENKKDIVWSDNKQTIHHIMPGKKWEDSLVIYLSTEEGKELYDSIVMATQAHINNKKKETVEAV